MGSLPPPSSGIICPVTPLSKPSAPSSPAEAQGGQGRAAAWLSELGGARRDQGLPVWTWTGRSSAERPPPTEARPSCLRAPHSLCPPGEQWAGGFPICGQEGGAGPVRAASQWGMQTRPGPRPGARQCGGRARTWQARPSASYPPAQSVPSPGHLHRPHPCSLRQGPGHSPARGETGSVAGWMERVTQAGGGLGESPALPTCHATENHRETRAPAPVPELILTGCF